MWQVFRVTLQTKWSDLIQPEGVGQSWRGRKEEEHCQLLKWHIGLCEANYPSSRLSLNNNVRSVLVLPPFHTRGKMRLGDAKQLVQGFTAGSGRWRLSDLVYSLKYPVCAVHLLPLISDNFPPCLSPPNTGTVIHTCSGNGDFWRPG